MEIVAKTTNGVLITATNGEVNEILRSVNGRAPEKIEIGQKIPAIDYAGSITKIKTIKDSYDFKHLSEKVHEFADSFLSLKASVENASTIEQ